MGEMDGEERTITEEETKAGGKEKEPKTFKELGLCDELVDACEKMEWLTPTKIQVQAIPHALDGKNLIALAQTGSEKTGAFALPIIQDHNFPVLDEADRLLDDEFEKSMDELLEAIPRDRKTYLFSATMIKKVRKLQRACLWNPVKIEAASKYSTSDKLIQQLCLVPPEHKARRLGAVNKFKSGECNILVCTDVASRGLDFKVDLVINYEVPSNSKDYIHCVGQTARAERSGVAISLVSQYDLEWYLKIEALLGFKLPVFPAQEDEALLLLECVTEAKGLPTWYQPDETNIF